MPRALTEEARALRVRDPISGSVLTLYYRVPTSEERLAYQTSAFRLDAEGPRLRLAEARLEFGQRILTGFASGDFTVIQGGKETLLEIDAQGQWKEYLQRFAPDLVSFLGQYIFEGLRVATEKGLREGEW